MNHGNDALILTIYSTGEPKLRVFSHPHHAVQDRFSAGIVLMAGEHKKKHTAFRLIMPAFFCDSPPIVKGYGGYGAEDTFTQSVAYPLIRCWRAAQLMDLLSYVYDDTIDACWMLARANDPRRAEGRLLLEEQLDKDELKNFERQILVGLPTTDELTEMLLLVSGAETHTFIDLAELKDEFQAVGIKPTRLIQRFLDLQEEWQTESHEVEMKHA